ncbi:TraB/GumN family protein [Pseudoroseicyclus sp. H15]
MRRILTTLTLLTGLAAAPLHAACTAPSLLETMDAGDRARLTQMAAGEVHGEGVLWQAEKDGRTIVLAGTMHLPDPRTDPVFSRIADAMQSADVALFEMTRAEEAQMTAALTDDPQRMLITEGPDLRARLDAETWRVLAQAARARGIPPAFAAKVQPWFLVLTLSAPPCLAANAIDSTLDHRLMDRATANGAEVRALEPWDTLLTIVEAADAQDELDMLRLSLQSPELQEQVFNAVMDLYFDERISEIMALTAIAAELSPGVDVDEAMQINDMAEEALLYGRNDAWMPVILQAAAQNDETFVAVGAAHLPGERGLLGQLEAAGWAISPR